MQDARIRRQILDAAARRFGDYGYGKTTVAEIAADCGMSSGNVYRYFESKEAIALAGVEAKLEEKSQICEQAPDFDRPAITQLHAYLLARLRYTHGLSCSSSHVYELVQLITDRHRDLIDRFDVRAIDWMTNIIEHGMQNGEFRTLPAKRTAASIFVATLAFCVPIFMLEPLESMEAKLEAVVELLHEGMKA